MKGFWIIAFSVLLTAGTHAQQNTRESSGTKIYGTTPKMPPANPVKTPDQLWGKLFVDVQLQRALGDNKTFVDAVPKFEPAVILQRYAAFQKRTDTSKTLRMFVEENFKIPVAYNPELPAKSNSLKQHLNDLWPVLTRKADTKEKYSSLLPLPHPYVVPGGRFREIYYWDSYFTMQGLAVSNRFDLIENMLDNFKYLVDTYGHIPNGNRSYYLSRSQPPYFAMMVDLLQQSQGQRIFKKYLSAMETEYNWWMQGAATLQAGQQHRRVVSLPDGTIMNRYWDDKNAPREELYYQDVQTGLVYTNADKKVYTHLRAGAESGWDFSSRWLSDTMTLGSIETTDIVPVDLNCLMYNYEKIIEKALTGMQQYSRAKVYHDKAAKRRAALLKYCWNDTKQFFFDYHIKKQATTDRWSLAGVFPMFSQIATRQQALQVQSAVQTRFLKDGGLLTTPYQTGQQWDAPNGWAPLQFVTVTALSHYSYDSLAKEIATRWMKVNETVYQNTGKMMEKYNVENTQLESGGGEYPSQDGFGWSNGVYLKFYSLYKKDE